MQKAERRETKAFLAVKKALEDGNLKKGQSGEAIREQYGEPVVILRDKDGTEKWIYKPAYSTHFSGIKIYLFFNKNTLTGIKVLNSEN